MKMNNKKANNWIYLWKFCNLVNKRTYIEIKIFQTIEKYNFW